MTWHQIVISLHSINIFSYCLEVFFNSNSFTLHLYHVKQHICANIIKWKRELSQAKLKFSVTNFKILHFNDHLLGIEPPNSLQNKANVFPTYSTAQAHTRTHTQSYCFLCCFPSAFYVIEGGLTLMEQVILGCAVSSREIEYLPKAYG